MNIIGKLIQGMVCEDGTFKSKILLSTYNYSELLDNFKHDKEIINVEISINAFEATCELKMHFVSQEKAYTFCKNNGIQIPGESSFEEIYKIKEKTPKPTEYKNYDETVFEGLEEL